MNPFDEPRQAWALLRQVQSRIASRNGEHAVSFLLIGEIKDALASEALGVAKQLTAAPAIEPMSSWAPATKGAPQ